MKINMQLRIQPFLLSRCIHVTIRVAKRGEQRNVEGNTYVQRLLGFEDHPGYTPWAIVGFAGNR